MKETVVIIGGTSGMGLATAALLASEGNRLIISGRSRNNVERALKQVGGKASGFPLDFTSSDSVDDFFSKTGPFEHLALVGSGQAAWGPFRDLKLDALKARLIRNSTGIFSVLKRDSRILTKRAPSPSLRVGQVVLRSPAHRLAAVNGAIQAMAFTLAKELAPIRVNILSPGLVDTPMYDWMTSEEKKSFSNKWEAKSRLAA